MTALPRPSRAVLIAMALAALAAAALAVFAWQGTAVEVVSARTTRLTQTVVVSGRVLAPARVDIGATITGRVQAVKVDAGDPVKADQALIELERTELAAALAQAVAAEQAAMTRIAQWRDVGSVSTREQLAQAEANYRNVERDSARQEQLFKQGFIGESRLDEARRALIVAKSQYENARAQSAASAPTGVDRRLLDDQLAQARAARETAAAKLAQTVLRAPAAGVVLERSVEPGDIVQPGKRLLALALDGEVRLTRVDRREESGRAARGPARAGVGGRLSESAVRRRAVVPFARDRRAARHRGGEICRSGAAALSAFRHDRVDRHRGRGQGRWPRRSRRRGARAAVAPALGAGRAGRPRGATTGADRRPHGRAGRSALGAGTRRHGRHDAGHRARRARARPLTGPAPDFRAMNFEWVVALRFLREGRFQTALIIGGAAAGVAVVIFITALVNGLQANTLKRVLGTQAHIVIRPTEEVARTQREPAAGEALLPRVEARAQRLRSIDQWQSLDLALQAMRGITAVSPMVSGPGFAVRGDATKSVALFGVEPDRYNRIVAVDEKIVAGGYRVQAGEAVIGKDLAKDLGLALGDRFRIVTAETDTPVSDALTVTGIVDLGVRDLNRRTVFVTLRAAQSLLGLSGGATQLDLKIDDLFEAEDIARRLEAQTGLTAESWMRTNEQLLAAINAQDITTRTIRGFVIVIVALGIASVLVVWVVQKRREIGILRAMGASRGQVQRVFLLQGAIVAIAGSAIGCALAIAMVVVFLRIARNADGSPLFVLTLSPWLFLGAVTGALVGGLLAAAAPARRAAALDPAQAIRM